MHSYFASECFVNICLTTNQTCQCGILTLSFTASLARRWKKVWDRLLCPNWWARGKWTCFSHNPFFFISRSFFSIHGLFFHHTSFKFFNFLSDTQTVMNPLFCSASWVNKMCVGRCMLVLENVDPTQQIHWSLRQNTPPKKERKDNVYYRNCYTNLIPKIHPLGLNLWHENIGIVLTRTSHYNTAKLGKSRESRKKHIGGKYQPDSGEIQKRRSNELSWKYPPEGTKIQKGTTDGQICYKVWSGER